MSKLCVLELTYNFNGLASTNCPNQFASPNMFYFTYLGPATLLTKIPLLPPTTIWKFASVQNLTVINIEKTVKWILSATDPTTNKTLGTIGWDLNIKQLTTAVNVGSIVASTLDGIAAYATGILQPYQNATISHQLDTRTNQRVFVITPPGFCCDCIC